MPVLVGIVRPVATRAIEQFERARITAAGSRHPVESRNGFDVVVEDVWSGVEHRSKRRFVPLEVRDQHFDPAVGNPVARLANGVHEHRRTAVRQVVAVDRRDHGVP